METMSSCKLSKTQFYLFIYLLEGSLFLFVKNVIEVQLIYTVSFLLYNKVTQLYIYILFHVLFHHGLSQAIEYSSLCYTVGSYCLSILYTIICIC